MGTVLVAGLLTLAGTLMGLLGTLIGSRRASEAARDQRKHDYNEKRHADYAELLSEFFGAWSSITRQYSMRKLAVPDEKFDKLAVLATRVTLVMPPLQDMISKMIDFREERNEAAIKEIDKAFTEKAGLELKKYEPFQAASKTSQVEGS